jgi:uncharacterized protein involved in outer membrane biogenesis
VLNRVYIVIGVLAILILAAAFVVPNLIPWGDYRGRLQMLASQALGADVRVNGDIRFSLLPAPHLELTDVSVGPAQQPVIAVKSASADFSLMDFLRDHYSMTRLVLDHPLFDLRVNADGSIGTGLKPSFNDADTALSIANAEVNVGTLRLSDVRSGQMYALEGITGELTLGALNGPVGFSGGGSYGDQHYNFHLTAAALDKAGNTQVSLFAQPDSKAFSVTLDGALATTEAPHFVGTLSYRQAPAGGGSGGVVGDLTFDSKIDATPAKVVLGNFTLVPDENRAVTRFSGDGTIDIGKTASFTVSLSSGALALPPRDATAEQGPQPYELVRMLGELPIVPVPPIPGTLAASADTVDLRSFSLQNVKLLATTDGKDWSVDSFTGTLPGNSKLQLAGDIGAPDGRPSFSGTLSVATSRLDALATLWRKPPPGNPLFNMPGSFSAKVSVLGPTMALTDGQLTLDGVPHALTALIKFGQQRRIDLSGQFKTLSPEDSAALLALVPDFTQDASAAVTFPEGAVSLSADAATVFGLPGKGLAVEGKWANGEIELSQFAAKDLGGIGFDLSLALSGTLAQPRIAGDGDLTLAGGGGPALTQLFGALGTPPSVQTMLMRSLPADLKAHLDDPADGGAQGLSLSGKAGVADVTLVAQLDGGLLKALAAPISANLDIEAADAAALTAQLGLGDASVFPTTGAVKLTATLSGNPGGALKTDFAAEGAGDSIAFDGSITPGDLSAPSGNGKLTVALSDPSVLAAAVGVGGIAAPPVKGSADIRFDGHSLALDKLTGSSGDTAFSGRLALNATERGAAVTGALTLDKADLSGLVAAAAGPAALLHAAGKVWPDGPLSAGDAPRRSSGDIEIETPAVSLGATPLLTDAGFVYSWDTTSLSLHKLAGKLGGGTLNADVTLCCAGATTTKQMSGEAALHGVALEAVLPPAVAQTLSGTIDASARFSGQGDSIEAVLDGLTGDGSFKLGGGRVQKFDPAAFAAIAALPDIVNLQPQQLSDRVAMALDQGPFTLPPVDGGFTVAGGVLRIPNLAADTPSAHLFGGLTVKLADLSLGGSFALTPVGTLDKAGIVSETTSKVTANLAGTLTAPSRTLDIASMVDAIKVKALEVEVARLEALKAAEDARAAAIDQAHRRADAAAAKDAREDAAMAAQAAAEQKAADAAKKAAAAAAAAAAREAARQQAPLDLQMPAPGSFQ